MEVVQASLAKRQLEAEIEKSIAVFCKETGLVFKDIDVDVIYYMGAAPAVKVKVIAVLPP